MTGPLVEDARNMSVIGHIDLDGKGDGMHVNVVDGVAYMGHMGYNDLGTSIIDVSDPTRPRLISQIARPEGTHSHKVQVVGSTLLVNHERNRFEAAPPADWSAGMAVYDVSDPASPQQIGFYPTPGTGVHRMTWWEGNLAYLAGTDDGYDGRFLQIVDLTEPAQPVEVGRWWYPGQHLAGGETPDWIPAAEPGPGDEGRQFALHHALPYGDRAYAGYWDAGLVILDISDAAEPKLVGRLQLGPESRNTHTAFRPPGRDILLVTDEQLTRWIGVQRHVWVVDISDDTNPQVISRLPVPDGARHDEGVRWGPHNLHEMRPGSFTDPNLVYLTYFGGGLRAYDISDAHNPVEVAHLVPPAPAGRDSIQFNDVTATEDGLVYVTDRHGDGLYVVDPGL
ncbi:MAG: LVIVD repeat-containing protein [Acidimicrobiia bacterium]